MLTYNDKPYREVRCPQCRKLICYEYIFAGRLAFNCPRCGEFFSIDFKHMKTKSNEDIIEKDFISSNTKGGDKT